MFSKPALIIGKICLVFILAACGGDEEPPAAASADPTAVTEQQPATADNVADQVVAPTTDANDETEAEEPVMSAETLELTKHYVTALDAARNDDWATVDSELAQIVGTAKDPGQQAVAKVLQGKRQLNDNMEVMVHIMKLMSLPQDKAPVYVWYREIYRHAKAAEWPQLETELHETMTIAPPEAQAQLQGYLDKLKNGQTDTLAQEIKDFTGVTEED